MEIAEADRYVYFNWKGENVRISDYIKHVTEMQNFYREMINKRPWAEKEISIASTSVFTHSSSEDAQARNAISIENFLAQPW